MSAEHPGFDFVEQHDADLPSCRRSLARYVRAYTDFLRDAAECDSLPVDLGAICTRFKLTATDNPAFRDIGLDGANVDQLGLILIDGEAVATRQRFTLAHELVEKLVRALRGNVACERISAYLGESATKEKLCDWGASHLLMPLAHLRQEIGAAPAALALAQRVATRFDVSLLAALRAVAEHHPTGRTALVVWRLANKPKEMLNGDNPDQTFLFDAGTRVLPPKKVRASWTHAPRTLMPSLVGLRHGSVTDGSHVHETFYERTNGATRERVCAGGFDQVCHVDARRVRIGTEPAVVSLVSLPPTAPAHPTLSV